MVGWKPAWQTFIPDPTIVDMNMPITVDSTQAYICGNRTAYAFNLISGNMSWSFAFSSCNWPWGATALFGPLIQNNVVYFSDPCAVYALDTSTGKLQWSAPSTDPAAATTIQVLNSDDGTIFGMDFYTPPSPIQISVVWALSPNGTRKWTTHAWCLRRLAYGFGMVFCSSFANGYSYSGNETGIMAFNANTGQKLWNQTFSTVNSDNDASAPAVDLNSATVYVGIQQSWTSQSLNAYRAIDGSVKWSLSSQPFFDGGPPQLTSAGSIMLFDGSTLFLIGSAGSILWMHNITVPQAPTTKWAVLDPQGSVYLPLKIWSGNSSTYGIMSLDMGTGQLNRPMYMTSDAVLQLPTSMTQDGKMVFYTESGFISAVIPT
jgi:outer membrane protein assembly factor BamB